jgi:hypothetical protein
MGVTYRYVVYDLLNDLKQMYDDADITPFKVLYWVMVHADRLKKQHIEKVDSGAYSTRFDVPVVVDQVNGRHYITLPGQIYDYDKDKGVDYITYDHSVDPDIPVFASVGFTRTTPSKAARLYYRDDERPSASNPYFYRQGERLYFLGTEEINLTSVEVALKLSFDPTSLTMELDDPFEFPSDLIPTLKMQILNMGRFVLQIPRDLINDGAGAQNKQMPTQKLISVNQPEQQVNTEQDGY